jgi:hypothetical protein
VQEPGLPPTFTVSGSEATLAVDRIENPACDTGAVTVSISVHGLPAGSYTLGLVARAFEAPDITGTLQIVPLTIGQGVAAQHATIPGSSLGRFSGWLPCSRYWAVPSFDFAFDLQGCAVERPPVARSELRRGMDRKAQVRSKAGRCRRPARELRTSVPDRRAPRVLRSATAFPDADPDRLRTGARDP